LIAAIAAVDGHALVRLVAKTQLHHVTAADEVGEGEAQDAWHDFADLMRDVTDSATDLDAADRDALGRQVDDAVAELRHAGARVIGGGGRDPLRCGPAEGPPP
jgi:hypothetical protein